MERGKVVMDELLLLVNRVLIVLSKATKVGVQVGLVGEQVFVCVELVKCRAVEEAMLVELLALFNLRKRIIRSRPCWIVVVVVISVRLCCL